ncbi:MAG: SagB/ThcOx family dehydrogenase [Planctomycetota bacterium]
MTDSLTRIRAYHEQTKHHPDRYARSLGFMEWHSQPNPFRRYEGSERYDLDYRLRPGGPLWDELFRGPVPEPVPLDLANVACLLRDSLALSAWKQLPGGPAWTLRVNPSSGNLHPTEAYLLLPGLAGAAADPSLYHYAPYEHILERRRGLAGACWDALAACLPPGGFFMGLSSIFWRESWKYGERAYRYCQHDIGHIIAALDLSARCLGWRVRVISGYRRSSLARLLAIDDQQGPEAEHAECLLAVLPIGTADALREPDLESLPVPEETSSGSANRLSPYHHDWPIIDSVAAAAGDAARGTGSSCPAVVRNDPDVAPEDLRACTARQIIHQRRSAIALDGRSSMPRAVAARIWRRLLPQANPWWDELMSWPTCISPLLLVHRVEGLEPGIYALPRSADHLASLKTVFADGAWLPMDDPVLGPDRLHLLRPGSVQRQSMEIACQQEIAANGAFAVAMLADFERMLERFGCSAYAQMFWECGALGQALYCEAEAAGYRGTGLGCYLDDGMHALFGTHDRSWQDLYHFTVGTPAEDHRLRSADPYTHRYSDEDLAATG